MRPHEVARQLSRPSFVMAAPQVRWVAKLCEMSKDFLAERFRRAVSLDVAAPALLSYSCDSTPLKTTQMYIADFWDSRIVRRGRQGGSWNIQRMWFMGAARQSCLFTEPRKLLDGTMWSHYECYRQLCPTLRQCGHYGIAIEHR